MCGTVSFEKNLIFSLGQRQEALVREVLSLPGIPGNERYESALIKGIEHRVRNLLQTIAGNLVVQAKMEASPTARKSLEEAANRLQAAAGVWQFLLARLEDSKVNLGELTPMILTAVVDPDRLREVECSAETVSLPSGRALAFAFTLNELMANAFRHGKPPFRVSIESRDDTCFLCVTDSGPGLPKEFDRQAHAGFGLQIVSGLVESGMKGSFELQSSEGGTEARVEFPLLTGEKPSDTCRPENPRSGR
jgi:two-component sensor histidine kinase